MKPQESEANDNKEDQELAKTVLEVTEEISNSDTRGRRNSKYLFYAGGLRVRQNVTGNIYWYFIAGTILLIAVYLLAMRIL